MELVQAVADRGYLDFIQAACGLFPISGYKRDRGPLLKKASCGCNLLFPDTQLPGYYAEMRLVRDFLLEFLNYLLFRSLNCLDLSVKVDFFFFWWQKKQNHFFWNQKKQKLILTL